MAHRPHVKTITALFRECSEAVEVYQWLRRQGYTDGQVTVLLSDRMQKPFHDAVHDDHIEDKIAPAQGATSHGAVGAVAGAGLFAALGAGVAGLGLAAGDPSLAALAGGGVGAMVGGLYGGLVGHGFPDGSAKAYDRALHEDGIAIGVTPPNDHEAELVRHEFQRHQGESILMS